MAEGIGQAKETIKNELTCPLCLDIFQEPKRLPCDHIYCKEPCLQGLMLRSHDATITCPECRTVVQVPQRDVNNLPTAFRINRLKEAFETMQRDGSDSSKVVAKCELHPSQELALFCETCKLVLCRDCVLMTQTHKSHIYDYVTKVAEKYRQNLEDSLNPVRAEQQALSLSLKKAKQMKAKAVAQCEEQKRMINEAFESLLKVIQEEKKETLRKVEVKNKHNIARIENHEESILATLKDLSQAISSIENETQNLSDTQLLSQHKDNTSQLESIKGKAQALRLVPDESSEVGVDIVSPKTVRNCCSKDTLVYLLADPKLCRVVQGEHLDDVVINQSIVITLLLVDSNKEKCIGKQNISVALQTIRTKTVTMGTSTQASPGHYKVTCTPTTRGRHILSIKVNNVDIERSPFSIFVRKLPTQLKDPEAVIQDVGHPTGLTLFNDVILVAEHDRNRLLAIDSKFNKVAAYGEGSITGPSGIATDGESNVYVSAVNSHQVHKLSKDGRIIKTVGGRGKNKKQFSFPNGNCVNKRNELYVCDSENHRVKVYDTELNHIRTLGIKGTKTGSLDFPSDVNFDSANNVYIVDSGNHRIQKFTPEGEFCCTIGKKGHRPGELDRPIGIHSNNDFIYVTEHVNNRVSVFTTTGYFVTTFGEEYLSEPEGMRIDRDGYVYVTSHKSKIFVF